MEHDTTSLLDRAAAGDDGAAAHLDTVIYGELRAIAARQVGDQRGAVEPTALVHEAYLKLVGAKDAGWERRSHFRAVAARAVRQVLIDQIRAARRAKRGGGWERITLSGVADGDASDVDLAALHESMDRLQDINPRAARVVELRFFGGLTEVEIANTIGVSERTVRSEWRVARAWLRAAIEGPSGEASDDS